MTRDWNRLRFTTTEILLTFMMLANGYIPRVGLSLMTRFMFRYRIHLVPFSPLALFHQSPRLHKLVLLVKPKLLFCRPPQLIPVRRQQTTESLQPCDGQYGWETTMPR
jgi:hypothetical protein